MKHPLVAALLAIAFVGVAFASGAQYRRAAIVGASLSGLAGVGSILAMGRFARGGRKVVQSALAVMTVGFLLRILLVAAGTYFVVRSGESIIAFVAAFFVPYFVLAAVEGAYVHSLGRGTGPTE